MNTYELKVGDKTYYLIITARNLVKLEEALGNENPLAIFKTESSVPKMEEIIKVLYYALQKNHNEDFKNFDPVYDLFDEIIAQGGSIKDLIAMCVEVFKCSGLIPKEIKRKN